MKNTTNSDISFSQENARSQENAKNINKTFLAKYPSGSSDDDKIISIIGSWGTGKSTVKEILHEEFCKNTQNTITSVYDALQFEDKSQVTSELYNVVSQSLPNSLYCQKIKFKAIAQLKKESIAQSISTSQIWSIFIVGISTFLIYKLISLPELYIFIAHIIGFTPIHGSELILGFFGLFTAFSFRNLLLELIAGLLPRGSHVSILESIDLGENQLIILIDEIDRLTPESVKLLFDEVLIIKTSLTKANVKFKIFLFYDEDVIFHSYTLINTYKPHIFLQKFYDHQYRLPRVVFFDDLFNWFSNKNNFKDLPHPPTGKIIRHVANNIASFREFNKLIDYLNAEIPRFRADDVIRSSSMDTDIFFFSISLRFYFDLKAADNASSQTIYSHYLNAGINILNNIYLVTSEDLLSSISQELSRLSKPPIIGASQTDPYVWQILNQNISSLNNYCQSINENIELFNWSNVSCIARNPEIFKRYFEEKNFNLLNLIRKLSSWLQNSINQNHSSRLTSESHNYTISHIKNLYIKRIECIHFFLFIYIKLGNPIDVFFMKNTQSKIDCLIICAILKCAKNNSSTKQERFVVDSLIKSAAPNGNIDKFDHINKLTSQLDDISELFNESIYRYQACDLFISFENTTNLNKTCKSLIDINSLLFVTIFQNNPLNIKFNANLLKSMHSHNFNQQITEEINKVINNGVDTINRESYKDIFY